MSQRQSLPVEEIKQMLDEGLRQIDVAEIYNVAQCTISRIARIPDQQPVTRNRSTRVCSCCGKRPIAKGNRLLCSECFKGEAVEEYAMCAWQAAV